MSGQGIGGKYDTVTDSYRITTNTIFVGVASVRPWACNFRVLRYPNSEIVDFSWCGGGGINELLYIRHIGQ